MTQSKIFAICQSGGEFVTNSDGFMSYSGGEAHAIDIDRGMTFQDLKSEICGMFDWECDPSIISIKYFLLGNRQTLITVSNDKDLQRMVDFNADSITTDVYVLKKTESRLSCTEADSGSLTVATTATAATTAMTNIAATTASVATRTRAARRANATTRAHAATMPDVATTAIVTATEELKQQRKSDAWLNIITGKGQVFNSVEDFRDVLHKYTIAKGFRYKFIKNDRARVTAGCIVEDCPWRIYASKSSSDQKFMVKTINNSHTCTEIGKYGDCRATRRWIANVIKDQLRSFPDYSPTEIAKDIHRDYGIKVNYVQAYYGKTVARKELCNSYEESSRQLFGFCERIKETNPGSIATLITMDDSKFCHLFISFCASLHGFEHGCSPLLFLDGISLKVSRQWKLLAATAVDGENAIFPVAFAVVESETFENWHWFLEQLKSTLSMSGTITFISNRQNGLDKAVPQVFENSNHGYCLSHLIEDFRRQLEESWTEEMKNEMVGHLKSAAYAYKVDEFNASVENIKNASEDVAKWVLASQPDFWSNAFFKGLRYDNLSSNAVELFNNWITKISKKNNAVVQIVDMIRCKIMEMMFTRRVSASTWSEVLTPSMNQKLQQASTKAPTLEVVCSVGTVFEVNGNPIHTVNIEAQECTCRRWQVTGLPCMHAIAVFERTDRCLYDYCSKYFTTESYRSTYSLSINPIPDALSFGTVPCSPHSGRLPGRPKRKSTESEETSTRKLQCSRCKEYGHNKLTCKALI